MFTEVKELPKLHHKALMHISVSVSMMKCGFLSGPPVNASRYTHFSFLSLWMDSRKLSIHGKKREFRSSEECEKR